MNVQHINLFKINRNYTQSKNNKSNNNKKHTYSQIKDISNHFYVPFCGKNKEENNIQKLLKDNTLEQEKKDYLSFLTTIDGFEDATKGMKQNELRQFVNVCLFFSPVVDDILKGNYTCVFDDTEKPLFDLKSVAEYNKKYPQNPQNLNDMLFTDNSLIKIFLSTLSAKKTNKLSRPMHFSYFLDTEKNLQAKTIIKYSPQNNISKKEIQKYADTPINQNAKDLFKFKSIPPEMKKTLWELTEIPYFNALSKNLQLDQLELLMELTDDNKIFVLEALKGNILQINKKTKEAKPIIDLKQVLENNLKSSFQNQQNIFTEFLNNKLFKNCYEETFLYKNSIKKYPSYFFSFTENPDEIIPSFYNFPINDLILTYTAPEHKVSNLIVFKNDLNNLLKNNLENNIDNNENNDEKITLSPNSIKDFLKNSKNNVQACEIAYNFEEKIPYFNTIMQNSTEDDIKFLVKMQKRNPKLFEKLMNGKIKIDNLKLIDTKEIAQNNGNLNTLIQENSITVETFNEISNLEKLFGTEIKKITVKIEPEKNSSYYVEFFQNAEQNMPNLNIALNSLPEEFLKYLDIHDKTKFTLSIEK